MKWRHWLLLGRLIKGQRTGDLCDLYELEYQGYAFKDDGWWPTSDGIRAHREKLATTPSCELARNDRTRAPN